MQRGIIGIGVFSEFLIGCIISIIVDHAQADKEKYAELPFADRPDAPCEYGIPMESRCCFNPNGKYMAREYKGMNMHERHRLKREAAMLTETIMGGHR